MYRRYIRQNLEAALADTRVVLLNGARQTGKSTLVQELANERDDRYLTLDDPTTLALARSDPSALLSGSSGGFTVIDEVQLAPALFPALKREVDRDPRPGRFLLTGSANVTLLPTLAESLAGRIEVLPMQPLAQVELAGHGDNLVDRLFAADPGWTTGDRDDTERVAICRRIVAGGFPEAVARDEPARRDAWFRSYVATILQRDVREIANIDGLADLPRLLALLAARTATLMNASEISRSAAIAQTSLRRYLALLEATFLLRPLPAWATNLGKRLVRASKLHLIDSGLAAHLRGQSDPEALALSVNLGPLLESFVVQEVRKQVSWSRHAATPYHFRTAAGAEVDLVLEAPDGRVAGVEVKSSSSVDQADFRGLRVLAEAAGGNFATGVVVYLGEQVLQFGERLWAVPAGVAVGVGARLAGSGSPARS